MHFLFWEQEGFHIKVFNFTNQLSSLNSRTVIMSSWYFGWSWSLGTWKNYNIASIFIDLVFVIRVLREFLPSDKATGSCKVASDISNLFWMLSMSRALGHLALHFTFCHDPWGKWDRIPDSAFGKIEDPWWTKFNVHSQHKQKGEGMLVLTF